MRARWAAFPGGRPRGVAALLWIVTGSACGGLENAAFYLRNGFFWVKIPSVFVLALEIRPMLTFIRWRAARSRGATAATESDLAVLIGLNDAEVMIVVLIPFVAALMARGAWLF
jgi:uncharacterized membrane protein